MIDPQCRLFLVSSSVVHGGGYLTHVADELREHLAGVSTVLFVPYALKDHGAYAAKARAAFEAWGIGLLSIHEANIPIHAVEGAEAVFVGGGNTFRLLATLQEAGLLDVIRERALEGMPYVGSSAGTNVAAPTIRTTNDMPISWPRTLEALDLVPFQINPHYLDPDPSSTHKGETREERLLQYLEENERPVVGLREGGWIRVENGSARLRGASPARVFRRGRAPEERDPGATLDDLG